MQPLRTVGAVGVVLVLLGAAVAIAVPGVIAEEERIRPPADVDIHEVAVRAPSVSQGSATLAVEARLTHRGGPAENVTLALRATSLQSGLEAASTETAVGRVAGGGEHSVTASVEVPREGGYRLVAVLYRNGTRVATLGKEVHGVGDLTPALERSPVRFHRFGGEQALPTIEVSVADVAGDRATLDVRPRLTNGGDEAVEDLALTLVARQAESNLVADRARVAVGSVRPGRTVAPETTLEVPEDYNYHLDAVLWRDGVVVDSTRGVVNLAPNRTLTPSDDTGTDGLRVEDFQTGGPDPGTTTVEDSGGDGGAVPGFTAPVALAALAAVALLAGRAGR